MREDEEVALIHQLVAEAPVVVSASASAHATEWLGHPITSAPTLG